MSDRGDCINASLHHTDNNIPKQADRSNLKHLKPLSKYARMVCQQYNSNKPLCDIQVQIANKTIAGQKRKRDDSGLDETCETPLKSPCLYRSCSTDEGCVVDSLDPLSEVQRSTPIQKLIISKDVTPPRSKIIHSSSTPIKSTTLPQCMGQSPDSLPSPIPVLNWDRDGPSNLTVSLTGCAGSGQRKVRKVSHVHNPAHESKPQSATPETGTKETNETAVGTSKEEGVSVCQPAEVTLEVTTENEESFETSLPLQVQVKSKVVIPEGTKTVCQTTDTQSVTKPQSQTNRETHKPEQRPVAFRAEEDWQRGKKTYVESVKRHMETNGAGKDVMTELHHLMNIVAGQHPGQQQMGSNKGCWQHPSDLSKRNHRSRVRGPLLSLSEWQKRNQLTFRRFAAVPDVFVRSPMH